MSTLPPTGHQGPTQRIVIEQPGGMFGKLGKFLWIALLLSIGYNISQYAQRESYFASQQGLTEKYHSLDRNALDKVAIIKVSGAILDSDGFIKRQIDQVREDESVKAIVVRIDSPGGTVAASNTLYHRLVQLSQLPDRKLPLVVSMGSLCASGGYYMAMAVGDAPNTIYAEPATWTGSIGVIIPHYDLSGLLEKWNVDDDSIVSHRLKDAGSLTRKMTEDERKILQDLVDDSFDDFKDVVRKGRPAFRENDAALTEVATGQVFSANQALSKGLVDRIGFIEDAIDRAVELAGLSKDKVRVVKYESPPSLFETLTSGQAQAPSLTNLDLSQFLDLAAPRAFYLATWLPAIIKQ